MTASPSADAEKSNIQTGCVLFADVSESTRLYEKLGDQLARAEIDKCLSLMAAATLRYQGRVVRYEGDNVLAVFASPLNAAAAAIDMQRQVGQLSAHGNTRHRLHIGFHWGSVLFEANDIYGDTVNLASRITAEAKAGQILCSDACEKLLAESPMIVLREPDARFVKGRNDSVVLLEVVWEDEASVTDIHGLADQRDDGRPLWLHLRWQGGELVVGSENRTVLIGRDSASTVVINDPKASRSHCWIEARGNQFVLLDQSRNGTYVSRDGGDEFIVRDQELRLGRKGQLSLGHPFETDCPFTLSFEVVDEAPPPPPMFAPFA